jgi:hypothetical protein
MPAEKPWYLQRSFWFSVAAACSAAPTFIEPFLPLLPEKPRQALLALGVALAAVSARYARKPGADAQERVSAVEQAVTGETDPQTAQEAVKAKAGG